MKQRTYHRIISLVLAVVMVMTLTTAFAAEESDTDLSDEENLLETDSILDEEPSELSPDIEIEETEWPEELPEDEVSFQVYPVNAQLVDRYGEPVTRMLRSSGTLTMEIYQGIRHGYPFGDSGATDYPWYIFHIDGKLAYCIEPSLFHTTPGEYVSSLTWDDLSTAQRYAIGYAMLYGYDGNGDIYEHVATQVIIWEIIEGYMDLETLERMNDTIYAEVIGRNMRAAPYYEDILEAMRNHQQVPSFMAFSQSHAPTHTMPGVSTEYRIVLRNTNSRCSLSEFSFTNGGGVTFQKDGETLTVTSSHPIANPMLSPAYKGATGETSSLLFWTAPGEQVKATADLLDPVPAYMYLDTSGTGQYSLRIIKRVEGSGALLPGAEFEISHTAHGLLGTYTTDNLGQIAINVPWAGTYIIREVGCPEGYLMPADPDQTVYIDVDHPHAELTFFNELIHGRVKVMKVASDDNAFSGHRKNEVLPGAIFEVYNERGELVDTIMSGLDGIALSIPLPLGKYYLLETKAPAYFFTDGKPIHFELRSHKEIVTLRVENIPEIHGRVRVTKVSSEANTVTGDRKGDALAGAVFAIYNTKMELVDTITTGPDGVAISKYLPKGLYSMVEVTPPKHYYTDGKPVYFEIREYDDLIRLKVENIPEDIEVGVSKYGPLECMAGDVISYEVYGIANLSKVRLEEFYWTDKLPTDAVRLQSIRTGTWSDKVSYDVQYRTNRGSGWRTAKSGLSGRTNYSLDMRPTALRLGGNEYVTEFRFVFRGEIPAGFREEVAPVIQCKVLDTLPSGYSFTNRVSVFGRLGKATDTDEDRCTTVVWASKGGLPKTGL